LRASCLGGGGDFGWVRLMRRLFEGARRRSFDGRKGRSLDGPRRRARKSYRGGDPTARADHRAIAPPLNYGPVINTSRLAFPVSGARTSSMHRMRWGCAVRGALDV